MFSTVRLFAARALFPLIVAMSLGFGLLIAGLASILGILTIVAFRIAMTGAGREIRAVPMNVELTPRRKVNPAARPA